MAIKRIYETGFEWGNLYIELPYGISDSQFSRTILLNSTITKTGNYSLRLGPDSSMYVPFGYSTQQIRTGFHFYHPMAIIAGRTVSIIRFVLANDNVASLEFSYPDILTIKAGNTVLASTSSFEFADTSQWSHVGVELKLHNTNGWFRVFINGVLVINYLGKTDHVTNAVGAIRLGNQGVPWTNTSIDTVYIDDFYVDDTTGETSPSIVVPDHRFRLMLVRGNGYSSEWVGNDGDSIDNYLNINETPSDQDLSYLIALADDLIDSFKTSSFTIPDGFEITGIIPQFVIRSDNAVATTGVEIGVRYDDTNYLSSVKPVKSRYLVAREHFPLRPDDEKWTQEDLDNLEIVIRSEVLS